jgi:hypothetical protein
MAWIMKDANIGRRLFSGQLDIFKREDAIWGKFSCQCAPAFVADEEISLETDAVFPILVLAKGDKGSRGVEAISHEADLRAFRQDQSGGIRKSEPQPFLPQSNQGGGGEAEEEASIGDSRQKVWPSPSKGEGTAPVSVLYGQPLILRRAVLTMRASSIGGATHPHFKAVV